MKTATYLLSGVLVAALLALTASTTARADDNEALPTLPAPVNKMSTEQWDAFGQSIGEALASEHDGLQIGAMRLAIQYADYIDLNGSVIELMRIYRNHSDDQVRRLAVVAMGSLNSKMVISYLRLHEPYEQSPKVRRTIRAVIAGA